MNKKIAILSGGIGNEVEIAKKSATYYKNNLDYEYDYYELPKDLDNFIINKNNYNLAIPVFHGEYGEDGRIFAFLDILGINHIYSKYDTHAICLDKYKTNILLKEIGIEIPYSYIYKKGITNTLNFPLIVKPNHGGSSFYTYKVNNDAELNQAINEIENNVEDSILVQEFISGEEVSVGVINGEIMPIMSLKKNNNEDIFDYNSKYESEDNIKEVFGEITGDMQDLLNNETIKIYNFLECRDIARVDFIIRENKAYFLEVNTIPGMSNASIIPKSWRFLGRTDKELVNNIVKKYLG